MKKSLLSLALSLGMSSANAGTYFQNFQSSATGATNFTDGSQLFSQHLGAGGQVIGATYRVLQLTSTSTSNTRSAWRLPDLDPGTNVFAFSARWNAQILGNFPDASEGFSFNFGNLGATDLISTNYLQEDGYGSGLSLSVRTSSTNNPGFYLRVNGAVVAFQTYDSVTQWGTFNSKSHHFAVDWRLTNGVTVRVDGVTIFSNVAVPGFTPQAGNRFAFAARCSSQAETLRLDDVFITTGSNLKTIPTTAPFYKSSEYAVAGQTADKAFDGDINTKWLTLANAGHIGATVASAPRTAVIYTLTSAEDVQGRDPASWHFESTTDGGTNWLRHSSGEIGGFSGRGETHAHLVTNAIPAHAYRILITTNFGAAEIQLAEMSFYEVESVSPPLPSVTTQPADNLTGTGARLNGTVKPNSSATTAWFEWGATTNYGNSTTPQNIGNGATNISLTATLTGLSVGSNYHYRVVAQNAGGTTYGNDVSFTETNLFTPMPFFSGSVEAAVNGVDYNNDGYMDVFVSHNFAKPELWRSQNGTNFAREIFINSIIGDGDADWGDYDGDGYVDLLIARLSSNTVQLWRNQNGTNFTEVPLPIYLATSSRTRAALWGDYDNDGDLDFMVTELAGAFLYRNEGGGSFIPSHIAGTSGGILNFGAWGDYDNDGDLDFEFTAFDQTPLGQFVRKQQLLRNDGSGRFTFVSLVPAAAGYYPSWVDHNNDGYLDLVLQDNGIWKNTGGTNFTHVTLPILSIFLHQAIRSGDYDNDGRPDYLLPSDSAGLFTQLWHNDGNDNFSLVDVPGLPVFVGLGATWADFNNDGKLDLLFGYSGQILQNNVLNSNAPPAAPTGLAVSPAVTRLNFLWNAATDDTTPSLGLTYNVRIGTTPGGTDIVSPNSGPNGQRRIVAMGNMQTGTNAWFDLPAGTYYWAVQAVDQGFRGGPFSTEHAFSYSGFAPAITTKNAVPVVQTATLNADVSPGGLPTSVWFEYGLTTAYGQSTPVVSAGNKLFPRPISAKATNLIPGMTYHYRAIAQNDEGITFGQDGSFIAGESIVLDQISSLDALSASSANSPALQSLTNAVDNNLATKYLNFDKTNVSITILDPGLRPVRSLTLFSAEDSPERDPSSFTLEGSTDGINFALITSNAVPFFWERQLFHNITFNNTNIYTSYRLTFPTIWDAAIANSMQIAEVELLPYGDITYHTLDALFLTVPPGTSRARGPLNLFDHSLQPERKLELEILTNNAVLDIIPFLGASVLKGFELIGAADDVTYPGRRPSSVKIEGSNNGTNFTVLTNIIPVAPTINLQIQEFPLLNNTQSFTQYRITFGKPVAGTTLQVGELRLLGEVLASASPILSLTRTNNQVTVHWPDAPGFYLEFKTNLSSGTWTSNTVAAGSTNGTSSVTLPIDTAAKFFRLKKP